MRGPRIGGPAALANAAPGSPALYLLVGGTVIVSGVQFEQSDGTWQTSVVAEQP